MSKRTILSVLTLVASLVFAGAAHARCPVPPHASITVRTLDPPPRIDTSKSQQQIDASANGHGVVRKKGAMVLGTTKSDITSSIQIEYQGQTINGRTCVSVTKVTAEFGHKSLIVNLPREYSRSSCEYKVVHRHEMAHVAVNRNGVRKYAAVLRRELAAEVTRLGAQQVRNPNDGRDLFQKRLAKVAKGVLKRFESEITSAHNKIDTPGSAYDANGACRGW
ncbi:hypothetical protein ACFL12_00960 [Pseudomonadota bacterium]